MAMDIMQYAFSLVGRVEDHRWSYHRAGGVTQDWRMARG